LEDIDDYNHNDDEEGK